MKWRIRLREAAGCALIALLLGGALTFTMCDAFELSLSFTTIGIICACAALVCAMLTLGRVTGLITVAALAGACAAAYFFKLPAYNNLYGLVRALLRRTDLTPYIPYLIYILAVCLVTISYMLARVSGGVYPAILITGIIGASCWLIGNRLNVYYIAPALVALIMMFSRINQDDNRYVAAMPIALLSVGIALALVPKMGAVSPALQQFSHTLRSIVSDYVSFSDSRTLYSLQSDGYQAMSGQLGGPATPSDYPILSIRADEKLLLRGAIKREYTGNLWVDSGVSSRNLYVSPLRASLRDQVFGLDLPQNLQSSPALHQTNADVRFLSRGTSTLFLPHRISRLNAEADMVTYFNTSGEVFITRSVRAGDTYSFSAYVADEHWYGMDEYLTSLETAQPSIVTNSYLQLPHKIVTDVYGLTYSIVSGKSTPYQKALAIESYLKGNYRYTLTPNPPPDGVDFVSYFLLESHEGYCSYFASAMGVMARIVGIPSRYVEGYSVYPDPDEDGFTEVTGKSAHAWVELYFNGFGWLPFDPTPNADDEIAPQQNWYDPLSTLEPAEATLAPTYQPTEVPEDPVATSAPDEAETATTPPEEPTPAPTELPRHEDETPREPVNPLPLILGVIGALFAAAIAFIIIRIRCTNPDRIARRASDNPARLAVYYRAALTAQEACGMRPGGGETPLAYAHRLIDAKQAAPSFGKLAGHLVRAQYAAQDVTDDMCDTARSAYRDTVKSMRLREKLRWYRRRVRRGIGDVNRIP